MTGRYRSADEIEDEARRREKSFMTLADEAGLDRDRVKAAMLAFHRWETGDDTREDWTNCGYPGGVIAALVAAQ